MKMKNEKKNVLIALSGMSPAVLTEAVWGLAIAEPAVVPDEIIVLTTAKGRTLIQEQLLKGGIWDKLKVALSKRGVDIDGKLVFNEEMAVFTHQGKAVEDLPTRELNLEAANTMMRVIRGYAEDDGCVIHALMAGGRKTMSALFFSSMCLLGRKSDHIYHVLVSEGYEDFRLKPQFFFPQKGVVHKMTKQVVKGKKVVLVDVSLKSEDCMINLFDVPFVPMGEWAEQKCRAVSKGLNYENIINAVTSSMDAALYPAITIDFMGEANVMVDGIPLEGVSDTDFVIFVLLLQGFGRDSVIKRVVGLKSSLDELEADEQKMIAKNPCAWIRKFEWTYECTPDGGRLQVVRKAFYGASDKGGKRLRGDYARAKDHLKKSFGRAQQTILCNLLKAEGDGVVPSGFDYKAVCWKNVALLPKVVREHLMPDDAPLRAK